MSPRRSAGILLYRTRPAGLEVLLVHPGGPFWARKDEGAWTIPKGELNEGEEPWNAALRELEEETGWQVEGEGTALDPVRQAGGKVVLGFALAGDVDPASLRSGMFEMEWPPRSGRRAMFPEVDRAAWFGLPEARKKILAGQVPLLDQLERILGADGDNWS